MSSLRQLKKILEIRDFDVEPENLDRLKVELDFITRNGSYARLNLIFKKQEIFYVMMEQIRQMKRKQKNSCYKYFKSTRSEKL